MRVLLVNSPKGQCGVYQFGETLRVCSELPYIECGSEAEFLESIRTFQPDVVIFNHHPITMKWLNEGLARKVPSALIVHDFAEHWAGVANIYPDPTFVEHDNQFRICRPIPQYAYLCYKYKSKVTVGSFGFGFEHKGFQKLIEQVDSEFEEADIRIHIPLNTAVDPGGHHAYSMKKKCFSVKRKESVSLEVTHDYKSPSHLLNWLAENTINCFFYNSSPSEGCSSALDWAISAYRPIAITKNNMFRHLLMAKSSICIEDNSLKTIISNGVYPVQSIVDTWTPIRQDLERICNEIIRS